MSICLSGSWRWRGEGKRLAALWQRPRPPAPAGVQLARELLAFTVTGCTKVFEALWGDQEPPRLSTSGPGRAVPEQ